MVFIELNTHNCISVNKEDLDDRFVGKAREGGGGGGGGRGGIWGILRNSSNDFEMGGSLPLYGL